MIWWNFEAIPQNKTSALLHLYPNPKPTSVKISLQEVQNRRSLIYKLPPWFKDCFHTDADLRTREGTIRNSRPLSPLDWACTCCREGEGGGGGGLPSSFWGFVYKNVLKSVRFSETESLVTFLLKMLHISILDWGAAFLWNYQIENWSEIYLTTKHKESEGRWLRRNLSQFNFGVEATKDFFCWQSCNSSASYPFRLWCHLWAVPLIVGFLQK